jgi:hypothetical protein
MNVDVLIVGSSHMQKKSSRMMLRLPEDIAEVIKQMSDREVRTFGEQILYLTVRGIETVQAEKVNGAGDKPSLLRATDVSKERKRA